jgi:alpha-amylase
MAVGLICWVRSFTYDADGEIIKNADGPVFAAHPQPNLWTLLAGEAKKLAGSFDIIQLPPASQGYGEGYSPFQLRNYASNWGTQAELIAAVEACHAAGIRVSADLPFRQMSGSNKGPGVFYYGADAPGNTLASWFQYFGNPGETKPPFVDQDDVPDSSGDYAFGTVRSYQNSIPAGAVEADTAGVLNEFVGMAKIDLARWDDAKGMYQPSVLKIMKSQAEFEFYVEYDSGDTGEVDWYVMTLMGGICSAEDYPNYWHVQDACNGYNANQITSGDGGYWQWHGGQYAIGFVNNPDVATSWSESGGISQQIAFNLLLGYALAMCLPFKDFMVYGEDYFPASPNYPTGRGLQPFLDNLCWFSRTFAFGGYRQRWQDQDVFAYTRDGDGGAVGWSGGCLVVVNFNTLDARTITVQTTWPEGESVHNYSMTGTNQDYVVDTGGMLTVTVKSNYYSNGQSYLLIAPSGVNHPVKTHPIA